jgi:hypothetical protein
MFFLSSPVNARLRLLTVLSLTVLASACGRDDDKLMGTPAVIPASEVSAAPEPGADSRSIPVIEEFDINSVQVSEKDIGEFPFFMPPDGYKYVTLTMNALDESISTMESARAIYPLGIDRIHMVEGKTFKVSIYNEELKSVSERDFLLVQKHYEDAITAAGGVQVFGEEVEIGETHGTLAPEENELLPYSTRSPRRIYVIHKPDAEIWFEINCGGGAGCLYFVTRKGKM